MSKLHLYIVLGIGLFVLLSLITLSFYLLLFLLPILLIIFFFKIISGVFSSEKQDSNIIDVEYEVLDEEHKQLKDR